MNTHSAHRADIDGLRAVAVLLVIAYHAGIDRLAGGYVGVDVFFVLSGFLITGILLDETDRTGTVSLRRFWARRARRLLPMSALVLVATLAAGYWIVNPVHRDALLSDVRHAALYASNWRSAGQAVAYSDTDVADSLTLHFWSLSIEEQFYVAWPLLMLGAALVARRLRVTVLRVALPVTVMVTAASLWSSITRTAEEGTRAYFLSRSRIWELGAGALLAFALRTHTARRPLPRLGSVLSIVGVALVVGSALTYGPDTVFPGVAALAPVLGGCLLVTAGTLSPVNPVARVLSTRPFTRIGAWSYSLYLWHWPLVGLALLAHDRWQPTADTRMVKIAAIAAAFLLAAISHRFIENTVRHSTRLAARPLLSLALGAALVAVPVAAAGLAEAGSESPVTASGSSVREISAEVCSGKNWEFTCEYSPVEPTLSVVVVGDSHADQWMPAFIEMAKERGWHLRAWVKHACLFNGALTLHSNGKKNVSCLNWQTRVLDEIDSLGGVDLVVLARYGWLEELVLDDDGRRIDGSRARMSRWGDTVDGVLERLSRSTERLVVLRDTPEFDEPTMPECLADHPGSPATCARSLRGVGRTDQWMIDAERSAGVDDLVDYLDPLPIVCPTDPCSAVDDLGVPRFRDRHHLTRAFARSVWSALDALLAADRAS